MRLSFALRGRWDEPPTHALGAIAQLAERLDRTQEVGGSNPPSSIRTRLGSKVLNLAGQTFHPIDDLRVTGQ